MDNIELHGFRRCSSDSWVIQIKISSSQQRLALPRFQRNLLMRDRSQFTATGLSTQVIQSLDQFPHSHLQHLLLGIPSLQLEVLLIILVANEKEKNDKALTLAPPSSPAAPYTSVPPAFSSHGLESPGGPSSPNQLLPTGLPLRACARCLRRWAGGSHWKPPVGKASWCRCCRQTCKRGGSPRGQPFPWNLLWKLEKKGHVYFAIQHQQQHKPNKAGRQAGSMLRHKRLSIQASFVKFSKFGAIAFGQCANYSLLMQIKHIKTR